VREASLLLGRGWDGVGCRPAAAKAAGLDGGVNAALKPSTPASQKPGLLGTPALRHPKVEAISGRLSPLPKSRAKRGTLVPTILMWLE